MRIAAELLQRHIQTLVDDHQQWQTLIADNILWELAYAPAIGHSAKLSGRDEVLHHVKWFLGAVENFRFIDPKVYAFTDPHAAVAQVRAEALIKATGRIYRQEYVVFLRAAGDKIAYLREYFDPTRAAKSMDATILDLEPWFYAAMVRRADNHPLQWTHLATLKRGLTSRLQPTGEKRQRLNRSRSPLAALGENARVEQRTPGFSSAPLRGEPGVRTDAPPGHCSTRALGLGEF